MAWDLAWGFLPSRLWPFLACSFKLSGCAGYRHSQITISVHLDHHQALRWNVEVEPALLHNQ